MKRNLFLFFIVFFMAITYGCKKDNNLDDPTTYLWKKELLSEVALNPLNNSATFSDQKQYLVSTEYVYLTNAQAKEQEENKRKERTVFFYRFTRVNN